VSFEHAEKAHLYSPQRLFIFLSRSSGIRILPSFSEHGKKRNASGVQIMRLGGSRRPRDLKRDTKTKRISELDRVKHRSADHRRHRSLSLPLKDVRLMTCTESVLASGSCEGEQEAGNESERTRPSTIIGGGSRAHVGYRSNEIFMIYDYP